MHDRARGWRHDIFTRNSYEFCFNWNGKRKHFSSRDLMSPRSAACKLARIFLLCFWRADFFIQSIYLRENAKATFDYSSLRRRRLKVYNSLNTKKSFSQYAYFDFTRWIPINVYYQSVIPSYCSRIIHKRKCIDLCIYLFKTRIEIEING